MTPPTGYFLIVPAVIVEFGVATVSTQEQQRNEG